MANIWFVCTGDKYKDEVLWATRTLHPHALIIDEPNPHHLRQRLLSQTPHRASAVIGPEVSGLTAVNLAAALARDGYADEVVLVGEKPSGSLRSRAVRAGIVRVHSLEDLKIRTEEPATAEYAKELQVEAVADSSSALITDLDEPTVEKTDKSKVMSEKVVQEGAIAQNAPQSTHVFEVQTQMTQKPESQTIVRKKDCAPIVVVTSGRGGVGKSTLICAAALHAASWGLKVALVDLDLGSGNLFSMFGAQQGTDLARFVDHQHIDDVLAAGTKVGENITLWGPCSKPELAETVTPLINNLLIALSNEYELVLVDTSTLWTDSVGLAAQMCDRLLLVSDDRYGAVGATSRCAALAVRLGVARTRIMRVSSKSDVSSKNEHHLYRADIGLEAARLLRVSDGGVEVPELLSMGHAQDLMQTDSAFVRTTKICLAKVLSELGCLPQNEDAQKASTASFTQKPKGFFARMREAG
ncbi:nucleotide-binding protein [Atopobium fossor]|uniref:nucleotide-binding protein n=1 Tax=Atopobium fossor TaxID=39487 RepID=UPI00041DCD9D|nr:P-loop NTPase [Atopobium fossor]